MAAKALTNRIMIDTPMVSAWLCVPHRERSLLGRDTSLSIFAEPQGLPGYLGVHQWWPRLLSLKTGRRIYRATIGMTAAIKVDDNMGRTTVHARFEWD